MEKDIGKIEKNPTTDVIIRIDDFGGKRGVTIREFVTSERYTGFTKAGTRISPENFVKFREMINSIDLDELNSEPEESTSQTKLKSPKEKPKKKIEEQEDLPDY
jgi:hypothetical protein